MKAARYHDRHDIRVEEVSEPSPAPKRVLVEIEWCGICGSDLHEYLSGMLSSQLCMTCLILLGPHTIRKPGNPHPITGDTLPSILGHEFCGRVKSAPENSHFRPGQAVMVDPRLNCGSCRQCSTGADHSCPNFGFLGYNGGGGGGFSEVVGVEERMLYALPENVSLDFAAVIEPLAVAEHAIKLTAVKEWNKQSVLILGGGPVGFATIVMLRAHGVKRVIVSEPTSIRREQTAKIADVVLDPRTDNVGQRCRSMTDDQGVDVVFDCAGIAKALEAGMEAIRFEGTYINIALWEHPVTVPLFPWFTKEVVIKPSMCYNDSDFRDVIQMMAEGMLVHLVC